VTSVDCEALGTATVILGGGREKKEDFIDPAVGMVLHKKVGNRVEKGEPLCTVHYNAETRAARAQQIILESYRIGNAAPGTRKPLVHRVIAKGVKA
jgi:thymidine phosphorylase